MNLKKLNLNDALLQLGDEVLTNIIGKDRIKTLSKLTNKPINSLMIVELLNKRLGNQIFSDQFLRGNIIYSLKDEYKSYLLYGEKDKTVSEENLKKIINASWDRRFNYYKRLVEIFDLNETYLPEIPFQRESTKIVETYSDSNLGDKGLWKNIFLKIKYFFYVIKNFFFKSVDTKENKNLFDFQYRVKKKNS